MIYYTINKFKLKYS